MGCRLQVNRYEAKGEGSPEHVWERKGVAKEGLVLG